MAQCIFKIPDELFATAESLSFNGTYLIPEITQGSCTYRFEQPLKYSLCITNTGGAFLVNGTVYGEAVTECSRCLDEVVFEVEGEVEGYYLIAGSEVELTEDEEDEYELLDESKEIDLEPLLIAAMALAFPYVPLCDDDCKGLCPHCGANLNKETCSCTDEEEDIDSSNPFAALKNYKFND